MAIKEKAALYAAYIPLFSEGGIFIPTSREYKLGDDLYVLLSLPEDPQRYPVAGKVAWVTPPAVRSSFECAPLATTALRGLTSLFFGLLLGLVGIDLQTGQPRRLTTLHPIAAGDMYEGVPMAVPAWVRLAEKWLNTPR